MYPLNGGKCKGPLEGVRVIEVASWLAAPGTAAILGDCGADIIKIEPPAGGDPMRGYVPNPLLSEIMNYLFQLTGRNKRSIALDLATDGGRQVFDQLIESADVFITNYRSNVLGKLDISYERLRTINPRLVYGWITGLGSKGPHKERPGFDSTCFWARGGLMSYHGEPGETISQQGSIGDLTTSVCLAAGIMAALLGRERHGKGQLVEASLLLSGLWVGGHPLTQVLMTGEPWPKEGRKKAVNPLRNNYRTADIRWVMLTMPQSDRFWPSVVEAFGDEEPRLRDDRFDSHTKRAAHSEEIIQILDDVIGRRKLKEWTPIFEKYGFVWEPVQELHEVINDPQVIANQYITSLETPDAKVMRQVRAPFCLTPDQVYPRQNAPELSQHTEEILLELGYTWDDIQSFKEEKATG